MRKKLVDAEVVLALNKNDRFRTGIVSFNFRTNNTDKKLKNQNQID